MNSYSKSNRFRSGIALIPVFSLLFFTVFTGNIIAEQQKNLSLGKAVKIALQNYPSFKQSKNSIDMANIDVNAKRFAFLPDLNANSSFTHRWGKSSSNASEDYLSTDYSNFNFSISSNLNIFNGFYNIASLREAELKRESTSRNHLRFKQDVAFLTLQKYINTLIAKEFIGVEKKNLDAQTVLLEKIDDFFRAGKKPITDLYQQKASISHSKLNLIDAEQSFITAKLELNKILGFNSIDDFSLEDPAIPGKYKIIDKLNLRKILKTALKMRYDLSAQTSKLSADDKSIVVAKSGYWPKLSFFVNLTSDYSGLNTIYSYSDQLLKNSPAINAGLNLSIPIFNKNSVRNSVSYAKIQLDNDKLELEKILRQIKTEVKQAVENYKTAIGQIDSAESQLKYSKAALQSIRDRYNVNASTISELTQARALYKQAGFDLIKAKYNLLTRKAAVYYYSGDIERLFSIIEGKNGGRKK